MATGDPLDLSAVRQTQSHAADHHMLADTQESIAERAVKPKPTLLAVNALKLVIQNRVILRLDQI